MGRRGVVLVFAVASAAVVACATDPPPAPGVVGDVLVRVLAADVEQMSAGSPAHDLRYRARHAYQHAMRALRNGEHRAAALLLERAAADADLAVAIMRRDQWMAEVAAASATLDSFGRDGRR